MSDTAWTVLILCGAGLLLLVLLLARKSRLTTAVNPLAASMMIPAGSTTGYLGDWLRDEPNAARKQSGDRTVGGINYAAGVETRQGEDGWTEIV